MPTQVDPVFLAMKRLRRRRYQECADLCSEILAEQPRDQAVWLLKCRALTAMSYVDDADLEEQGIAELVMDDNSVSTNARPGTSLSRPLTSKSTAGVRPVSQSGRPLSGFARPGTQSRLDSSGNVSVDKAFQGQKPGTARPVTALGRQVRLGTASMTAGNAGGPFIDVGRLNMHNVARRPAVSRAMCEYLLYVEHNPKAALTLASEATEMCGYADWWWKAKLGKAFYQLGLWREAERQFKSSLKDQHMVMTVLELSKVYMRLDMPNTALELLKGALVHHDGDCTDLLLHVARIYDMLNDVDAAVEHFKMVLDRDPSNIEAIACMASNYFYQDQPEIALRFYRRLLQMGVQNTELWCNLGLCCFYASQYDMTLGCFERALAMASDESLADVFYNIGQVGIGIGDQGLAYQAFKIAIASDPFHAESYCNLGVLELRKQNVEEARSHFQTARKQASYMFEPFYNGALLAYKLGDFQESFDLVSKSLEAYPDHADSKELLKLLREHFTSL